jgi:NADH-quinone oxidoreductase subunit G
VLRLKPRFNADVNQWWMCDDGRFGFGWVDNGRLTKVTNRGADGSWDQALAAIVEQLVNLRQSGQGSRIGVLASPQLTNEELFLIREIFQGELGARVISQSPLPPGDGDDFLIKADKNPNTRGASLLGLSGNGPAGHTALIDEAVAGHLEALFVFGHDLTTLSDDKTVDELSRSLNLFVFLGSNRNPTVARSHWVLPTAAYLEKDGTFVNSQGRIQRSQARGKTGGCSWTWRRAWVCSRR